MAKKFDENSRVKIPAILHLTRLNYQYVSYRESESLIDTETNIYKKSFQAAVNKINRKNFTDSEVEMIIRDLKNFLQAEDLGRKFFEKLQHGITFNEGNVRLIDFENNDSNIWEVMTEVPYKSGNYSFRPDITIFLNGLPLAFIEVKIPDNKDGIQAEYNRMNERFSNEDYQKFINITQLMIFSNNSEYDDSEFVPLEGAFYATSAYTTKPNKNKVKDEDNEDEKTVKLFFNRFREEDNDIFSRISPINESTEIEILRDTNYLLIKATSEYETKKNPLSPTNRILTSLLSADRFLFILKYALAYVTEENKNGIIKIQKHIMRYQQMFATFKIGETLDNGIKRGVIWHTQGSGKTALAFHNVKFLTDYYGKKNTTTQFYFIVDRLELLTQAAKEFRKRGLEVNKVSNKEEFVKVIQSVGNFGNTGKLSINVVNIQKFSDESITKKSDFNINVQRIYFIDEAHRDYKFDGSFLARLMNSDRNAVMIALTGTPLIGEFKTRDIFGDYIHCYYYDKSIDDKYTLPLIREEVKSEYKLKLQTALKNLQVKIPKGSLDSDKIYSHKNFVLPLVDYIETDFEQSRLILNDESIGAMIVCKSSDQAREVAAELQKRGKFKTELILYDVEDLEDKRDDFKNGKTDILVVYQMLLTGFDAPRLKKLYLGRKIREHNLLQALTRVNRPYNDIRYGYVVDFADIQAEFDKTNQAYIQELKLELGEDFDTYQKIFKTSAEIESDLIFVKDQLSKFTTDNAEIFRMEIQNEDKKTLIALRQAIELYRECYNLAENYGYSDLNFDIKKISSLYKVVNNRINMLNSKEQLAGGDTSALLNLALDNVEFSFKKISEKELSLADSLVNLIKSIQGAFGGNNDNSDPKYVSLLEEFRRILKKNNIEELTADEMKIVKMELKNIQSDIQNLNFQNDNLTAQYFGDKKFMRIHKRVKLILNSLSQEKLFQLLSLLKKIIDDKISTNYASLDNESYFERGLWAELKKLLDKPTPALIKEIAAIIAQEYFDERKKFNE